MKVIVFKNVDGSVRVNTPKARLRLPNETDNEFYPRMMSVVVNKDPTLNGLVTHIMDTTDLPTSRTNRRKWRVKRVAGVDKVEVDNTVP